MAVIEASKTALNTGEKTTPEEEQNTYTIFRQLKTLWQALATSPMRFRIWMLSAGIVVAIGLNMVGQVRLNNLEGRLLQRARTGGC